MANNLNRALIACSFSALALTVVLLYYRRTRQRRRKYSDAAVGSVVGECSAAVVEIKDPRITDIKCTTLSEETIVVSSSKSSDLNCSPQNSDCSIELIDSITATIDSSDISSENQDSIRSDSDDIPEEHSSLLPDDSTTVDFHPTLTDSGESYDPSATTESISTDIESSVVCDSLLSSPSPNSSLDTKMHLKNSETLSISNGNSASTKDTAVLKIKDESTASATTDKSRFKIVELNKTVNNSVLSMEALDANDGGAGSKSNQQQQPRKAEQHEIIVKSLPSLLAEEDNADKRRNGKSTLHQTTNDSTSTDSKSIVEEEVVVVEDDDDVVNDESSSDFDTSADSGESNVDINEQKQQPKQSSKPKETASSLQAASAQQPEPSSSRASVARSVEDTVSNSVKPGQTFAQVLSSSKAGGDSKSAPRTSIEPSVKTMQPERPELRITVADVVSNRHLSKSSSQPKVEDSCQKSSTNTAEVKAQATVTTPANSVNSEVRAANGECNDDHSQGSNDSGKGSSDMTQTDPNNYDLSYISSSLSAIPDAQFIEYNFEIQPELCGKLIGVSGHFINSVKRQSGTKVLVKYPYGDSQMNICSIYGKKSNVMIALGLIRNRFPAKEHPDLSLQNVSMFNSPPKIPLPQSCQLHLLPETSTDVILSCTINAGHFFLQQPTHPTYPRLNQLDQVMTENYSQTRTPLIPEVHPGIVCAAPTAEGWFRALIKNVHESNQECDIMFVDYGGYAYNVPVSTLRQIRYDFMSLPFQAVECYLANVQPIDPDSGWTPEANCFFEEMAQGQIIYAYIKNIADNGVPCVDLFKISGSTHFYINNEMVAKGFAQLI